MPARKEGLPIRLPDFKTPFDRSAMIQVNHPPHASDDASTLEVCLSSIVSNLGIYRRLLVRPGTRILVMIKANAYGLGDVRIASVLQDQKVDFLGVAQNQEALSLRRGGIHIPILVFNPSAQHLEELAASKIQAVIHSMECLTALTQTTSPPEVHLKVNTGMNRLGFSPGEVGELCAILRENRHLHIKGVFTHLSSAESSAEDIFTTQQLEKFNQAYEQIAETLNHRPVKHALNSAGTIRFPAHQFDMVRLGAGLFGIDKSLQLDLLPVASLKSSIVQSIVLSKGESVGYGRAFRADKRTIVATMPLGYADGYPRWLGNGRGKVLVRGRLVPILGIVFMDLTVADITGVGAEVGDEVVYFGKSPTVWEVAQWGETSPYEILARMGSRLKRTYL